MKKFALFFSLLIFASKAQTIFPTFIDSVLASDGKYLKVDVYKPAGCTGQCPTILIQTPYNKLGFSLAGLPLGVKYNLNSSNYIFVIMDWRGRFSNLGAAYVGNPGTGKDGKDVVQWIASKPWSNGKVGTWGPSALGKVQFNTAKENPANLTCICPLVAAPQYTYADYFPGGCLKTEYVDQLDALGFNMSPMLLANPTKNLLWQYSESTTYRPDSVFVPALMIGGWYDHNIESMLAFYNGIRTLSPVNVRTKHKIQMGPWAHGGNGTAYVGSSNQGQLSYPNAASDNDSLAVKFFDFYLRNIPNGYDNLPNISYYQMGENNWNSSNTWPLSGITNVNYILCGDNSLKTVAPSPTASSMSYNYDPNDPSPTIGGATLKQTLKQGPWRQDTAVENRNDILVFSTEALANDVVMKGKAKVTLRVSSNRKDTDFDVRLCDVEPGGRSMLLQTGVVRMRFRNGYAPGDTLNMSPGTAYTATIELASTCNTFKAGHKIRLSVSSSNYPQYNRNMNTGGAMYPGPSTNTLVNAVIASNTVFVDAANQSFITLPIENPVGMKEIEQNELGVNIYPNPSKDVLHFEFNKKESTQTEIIDMNGRILISKEVQAHENSISLKSLNNGIYFIRFTNKNGISIKKILIEK